MEFSEPTAMKIAYVIATPEVRTPLMPGVRGVFADNLQFLKDLGYEAVEVAMRDPDDPEAANVAADFERVGLPAAMIGSAPSELQDGVMLCHPDANVREAGAARLRALIDMAARLGALGVNIGRFRGTRVPGPAAIMRRKTASRSTSNPITATRRTSSIRSGRAPSMSERRIIPALP
jgi:hypothetical protein